MARQTGSLDAIKPGHPAYSAAEGRWNQDLMTAWSHRREMMAVIVDAITPELYGDITKAEVQRRGGGFKHLIATLGHLVTHSEGQ